MMKLLPKDKIILSLCGGTGAWEKPYVENGYDVRNITLPKHDVRTYIPPENVYGILAAPPCTEFSLARTTSHGKPRDFKNGMELIISCLNIIWKCRYKKKIKFWALENPMGILRQFLGKPVFAFQGWQFGELNECYATKRYDIWGYFKEPKILIKERSKLLIPSTREYQTKKGWYSPKKPNWLKDKKLTPADIRAITPPGFAKAFFKSNQ